MGGDFGNTAGIRGESPPAWDRFAHWPQFQAQIGLLALLLILLASALVPLEARRSSAVETSAGFPAVQAAPDTRDKDLALYDRVIERIRGGESYYDFIAQEQRQRNYPVTPGFAVRLPTLAWLQAWLESRRSISSPSRSHWRSPPRGGGGWAKSLAG